MTSAPAPNPRASLLAGLRTGGVRSTSSPLANVPYTAAPGATFNIPRYASQNGQLFFQQEESEDQVIEAPSHNIFSGAMTAAVDGPNNRFTQQQRGMNPNSVPFSPGFQTPSAQVQAQAQALQMQIMQLEIIRLQSIQAQQYQAELLAQAQRQQQPQGRRASLNPPVTAGPFSNSFDLRTGTVRRAGQAEQPKAQNGVSAVDNPLPMSAALGGKFGGRITSLNTPSSLSRSVVEENEDSASLLPPTPNSTTVISGGTSLGNPTSNNIINTNISSTASVASNAPSKSESAVSWRRGGNNNSVLSGNNRAVISPSVKITPPPGERVSPPPSTKARPVPLRFSFAASQPLPAVAIDTTDADGGDGDDAYSTSSSKSASNSSPTTPRSFSSSDMPLSPREEAAKKLYEGLGIGRPAPAPQPPSVVSHRMASQPMRQPRGPPSGADELGPKNFATRIRRKAIGGLGVLMGARERREIVEAY